MRKVWAFFRAVRNFFLSILSSISVLIYNSFISNTLSKKSYKHLCQRINFQKNKIGYMLDVGVGTGQGLFSIIDQIPKDTKVLGIDIDKNYIQASQKLFKQHQNTEIREVNYFQLMKEQKKFDLIIFGMSIMLMPYQDKAVQYAIEHLNENGKIYFMLTLYEKKGLTERLIGLVKPYLKYLTTIDFGQITYRQEFVAMLQK